MGDLSLSLVSIDEVSPLINHKVWLEQKQHTMGASELAEVLGITGSRVRLFLRKTGRLEPDPPSEEQLWGLRLEPLIAAAFTEKTGRQIVKQQVFAVHPEKRWLSCTVDCLTEEGHIVEIKAMGPRNPHAWHLGQSEDSESLPDSWVTQAQQQMLVMDKPVVFFAVFGPGLQTRHFTLKRHDAFSAIFAPSSG